MCNWNKLGAAILAFALVMPAGLVMADSQDHDDKDHQVKIFVSDDDGSGNTDVRVIRTGTGGEWTVDSDRPFLGVVLTYTDKNGEKGAGLMQIVPDSPAARAGLEKGDVIVVLGGAEINAPGDLTGALSDHSAGDDVVVVVDRDGSQKSFTVTLGEQQLSNVFELRGLEGLEGLERLEGLEGLNLKLEGLAERLEGLHELEGLEGLEGLKALEGLEGSWVECGDDDDCTIDIQIPKMLIRTMGRRPMLGVSLTETTPDLREHLGADKDRGVLVSKVLGGMPAEDAGIEVGDLITQVDDDVIRNSRDLIEALHEGAGSTVEIEYVRDGRTSSVMVDLPDSKE